jgi:hypothetical protein
MTLQTRSITDYLAASSWNRLLVLLAAHQLPRGAKENKAHFVERLAHHLSQPSTLMVMITQLDPLGKDALRVLLAAGGALPVHPFEERFGALRPYRPWRDDDPASTRQPWLAPSSATEQLWYLGLLYRDPPKAKPGLIQHYVLPSEFIHPLSEQLLPPHRARTPSPLPRPGRYASLEHHLAIWLATLASDPIKPLRGGWLPPSALTTLAQRLGLAAPDPLAGDRETRGQGDKGAGEPSSPRSERQHLYLAFLHYLALVADFVSVGPTAFQLTPAAWAWLLAPTDARCQQLFAAWLQAPAERAQPFHFAWEPFPPQSRPALLEQMGRLLSDHLLPLADLLQQLRLHDPYGRWPAPYPASWYEEAPLIDPLAELCSGPLFWLGVVDLAQPPNGDPLIQLSQAGRWLLALPGAQPPAFPSAALCTAPKSAPHTLTVPFQVQPFHLAHLARLCHWETPSSGNVHGYTLELNPQRVAQAASQGLAVEQMVQQVAAALGRPPSRRLRQRLRQWAQQGQQVQLRPLLVLETATADLLAQLRRHQLVRRRLGPGLAPNRVAINPLDVAPLLQTLRTLGFYVEAPDETSQAVSTLTSDAPNASLSAAWQWLLLRLYEQLGQLIDLPLTPPWSVRQQLQAQLVPLQRAAAEASADQLIQQLTRALEGYLALPGWAIPSDYAQPALPPDELLSILQAAIADGGDLTIRYQGASRGAVTTRRVTPFRLEEQQGVPYLIGWCHLRQQERVFRLDRMEIMRR